MLTLTGIDWEMEQHWGLHHDPLSTSQLSFGWVALQGSGQQLQHWVAQPGAQLMAFASHRVGLIRVTPQFAVERESTGLGVLFILVKLSFLWEIGGRRGPPDKGLL